MSFSTDAWAATAAIRAAIDDLPFVRGLGDGTVSRDRFTYYMAQDALYLTDYSRALAALSLRAESAEEAAFWLESAQGALVAERELHAHHVADMTAATMSPTCRAYTAYLLSLAATAEHAVAAAGVLPCFWIYADVGERLLTAAGDLSCHPYGDWIGVYSDADFALSVEQAKALCDAHAERADGPTRDAMIQAFVTAARYEWMFWDAAWRQEQWPV